MSVITKLEDGTEIDDTIVTSIDSIMILKDMIGDDKDLMRTTNDRVWKKIKRLRKNGVGKSKIIIIMRLS